MSLYVLAKGGIHIKTIDSDHVIYSFKPEMASVARIEPGETFRVSTHDCFQGQIKSEYQDYATVDESKTNPATGPIFIEGAEPGDLLRVDILDIDVVSPGVTLLLPEEGVLGKKVARPYIRVLPLAGGSIEFEKLTIPVRPMIGVMGVAPSHEEGEWPTFTPWKHGGNLDTADLGKGSTLFLPVRQKGALLALGDCHAIMGDGEVGCSGLEVAARVTLKADLIKGNASVWPLLETSNHLMIIASGETLEEATCSAVDEATKYLQRGLALSWEDAYILASLVVDVKISQVVNPKKTVRAAIPGSLIQIGSIIS